MVVKHASSAFLKGSKMARAVSSRGLQNLAFVLLCALLLAIAAGSLATHALLRLTMPNLWGLTPLAWVLLNLCLTILLTPLILGPRPVLTWVAFALIAADAVFLLATTTAGRYTGVLSLLAVLAAALVAIAVMGRANPGRHRSWLLPHRGLLAAAIVAILALASITASLVAYNHYESVSWTFGKSPNGRLTLVYIAEGPDTYYFPAVAVVRTFGGLFNEELIEDQIGNRRDPAYWSNNRTIVVDGNWQDIYRHRDFSPV
jgi:hypothetical protein